MKLTTIITLTLAALAMASCACGDRHGRGSRDGRPKHKVATTQPAAPAAPSTPAAPSSPPAVATPAPGTGEMSETEVYKKYNSAVFTVLTNRSQGSGFFVSADGLAVSNWHVFKGSVKQQIQTSDENWFWVDKIIAYDADSDYVVFRITCEAGKTFNFLPVSGREFQVGDKVYAISSPLGYSNTLSSGIISQVHSGKYDIQTSASTDHGSSGGALINTYGEVIGITSAVVENSNANLNFAIDIRKLSKWLR